MPQDYERSKPRHDDQQKINQPGSKTSQENPGESEIRSDENDELARRDPNQSHDYKGESQNVNDDTDRTLSQEELDHARNKATEGLKQGRDRDEDDE